MNNNRELSLNKAFQKKSEQGVSLLEILIVMLIVSIVSYLSISSYQQIIKQRYLIQSVRETIAFLSYQRQQALLFNVKIKMVFLLSPHNKIMATPLHPLSIQQETFSLVSGIQLKQSTVSNFTFGGIRQTLKPMNFILQSEEGEVKIIISSLGRIRACSQKIKVFSSC
ncbi:prepilin-type N-terminal cleavage/methylation domain-containing protein [Proteus sp. FME41]|uniref:prepilin-type N-terminal cleavage/methylation domain-containing protein n=1 Tax=Proteus sp. FME41 TaxID=2742608 RepID=UPI00186951DF|nr:prepilin-type N-terminal cleavage/methylation domain-containing protein [Proteus sp. FME41]